MDLALQWHLRLTPGWTLIGMGYHSFQVTLKCWKNTWTVHGACYGREGRDVLQVAMPLHLRAQLSGSASRRHLNHLKDLLHKVPNRPPPSRPRAICPSTRHQGINASCQFSEDSHSLRSLRCKGALGDSVCPKSTKKGFGRGRGKGSSSKSPKKDAGAASALMPH